MKYKKYIIVSWNDYEAEGGINDIIGSCDTIEESEEFLKDYSKDYYEIVERDTLKVIKSTYNNIDTIEN